MENTVAELESAIQGLRAAADYQERVLCLADELVSALEPLEPIVNRCHLWPRIARVISNYKAARIPPEGNT